MKLGKIEKWFINRESHSKKVTERAEKLLDFIDIKPNQNFLEIGCGSGPVSKHISEKYKIKVVGTDVDEDQIEFAKENTRSLKNINFLIADATNLPFEDKSFDIILSINVLHHIPNWMDALREINRVLRNGGYLLLAELLFARWTRGISRLYSGQAYGITTIDNLNLFIAKNHYSIIHSRLLKSFMWNNLEAIYKK
jgi:ubiquinone/menaquinone biosynthesis C-methylase UbiE